MALDSAAGPRVVSPERWRRPDAGPAKERASGGAGAGKVTLQDFNLTKRIDPLSTELTSAAATGAHNPEVAVSIPIGGPGAPFAVEYELRPVFVSSIQQSGSADQSTETVSLTYGAFTQTIGNTARFGFGNDG